MLGRAVLAGLLVALLTAPVAAALRVPPAPEGRVNDYAGALTPAARDRLEQKLIAREATSRNQVVVAVFRSLEGESLEGYSIRLAQAWRIGQKGLDNGVIFLVFLDDRKMRIEVGYGLEASLTDAVSASILREIVAPRFREGRIADGILAGLDAIDAAIAGTYTRPLAPGPGRGRTLGWREMVALLFVLALLAALVQNRMQSAAVRRRGWTGGPTGWGGPFMSGGGGFGSRGGGGGFSGGGGGFGGGGSSGSW